jgi:hypothetical protein
MYLGGNYCIVFLILFAFHNNIQPTDRPSDRLTGDFFVFVVQVGVTYNGNKYMFRYNDWLPAKQWVEIKGKS